MHKGSEVAIFELRGGTHLVLIAKSEIVPGDAPFDLMVEDLRTTHRRAASTPRFFALSPRWARVRAAAQPHR